MHKLLLFSIKIFLSLFIWLHWVSVSACGLSLVAVSRGCFPVEMLRLLIALASLAAERRL